jgi:hypothetical protein
MIKVEGIATLVCDSTGKISTLSLTHWIGKMAARTKKEWGWSISM